jgi:hypothetical protein
MGLPSEVEIPGETACAPRWVLTEIQDGQSPAWTWSRCLSDGSVETTSGPFAGYGEAITDAIANGFMPKDEAWAVVSANGITSVFNRKALQASLSRSISRGSQAAAGGSGTAKPSKRQ